MAAVDFVVAVAAAVAAAAAAAACNCNKRGSQLRPLPGRFQRCIYFDLVPARKVVTRLSFGSGKNAGREIAGQATKGEIRLDGLSPCYRPDGTTTNLLCQIGPN